MRFPVKGTVFTVFFLLINTFFIYLQPAQAENTVSFKMVILPAKKTVVEDIGNKKFGNYLIINNGKIPTIPVGFFEKYWKIS